MAASDRTGTQRQKRDITVAQLHLARELESPSVLRWASVVLDGERAGPAALSITFLSERAMRALNGRALGHDRVTDVIAFRFEHLDAIAGDIYVCPVAARRSAHEAGISPLEELLRLVVHGVLHVLGHDHPDDASRTASSMWKLQERYVQRLKDVQDR